MRIEQQMVKDFHDKFGFKIQGLECPGVSDELEDIADVFLTKAEAMKEHAIQLEERGDTRHYRTHLMMEELGELIVAMADMNRVAMADALADLLYVVLGTAVNFRLPSQELFHEIHRSNMTKQRKKDDPRMKNKGEDYSPPDLERILR